MKLNNSVTAKSIMHYIFPGDNHNNLAIPISNIPHSSDRAHEKKKKVA